MIRLGLRLTLKGGREAAARLVITSIAVALGVGMLLITLAAINAVNAQNAKYAWLETGAETPPVQSAGAPAADPLWWLLTADELHGRIIGRVDVAPTGPQAPIPPGIAQLPGPGQFYASPAMSALLRSAPTAELADRYPGKQIGTIGPSALPAPDSLIIVVGSTPSELSGIPGSRHVTRISTTVPSSCVGATCFAIGIDANGIDLVLSVAAAALLFPVLIFIGTAARLSAARREQRFAAMRLVGATPRQISVISTVESTVAAGLGVIAGFGLFFLTRPPLATIPFTGSRFYLGDLSLSLADTLVVAVGVPVAAAVAARIALRRVQISPLGVSRRVTPAAPRAYRLIPLLAGIGELAYFVKVGRPDTTPGEIEAFMSGILLTMAGLVSAGPWFTMVGAKFMFRRTRRPALLIAGRRLADNPRAGFRAISGLVLALFVTSVAVAIITTIDVREGAPSGGAAAHDTMVDRLTNFDSEPSQASTSVPAVASGLLHGLQAIPGVQGVTMIHADYGEIQLPTNPKGAGITVSPGGLGGRPASLVSCSELRRTPSIGRCAAGAETAVISDLEDRRGEPSLAAQIWPAADVTVAQLQTLPLQSLAVATDGSSAAIEQARTVLERTYPYLYFPLTLAEEHAQNANTKLDAEYKRLVDVVILTTLPIAGCSLAVSVVAGLNDRKRPFSLLRLTGAPLSMLRRVVALESAVPLLVLAVVSTATGFLAAGLFLSAQLSETLAPPNAQYYLIVLAGLVLSLAVIASTLPLLKRITGPETARNE
jgi:hypothetical protein